MKLSLFKRTKKEDTPVVETKALLEYTTKSIKYFSNPEKSLTLKHIKYLYKNDVSQFIKGTYPVRVLSKLTIVFGIFFLLLSAFLMSSVFAIFGTLILLVGVVLYVFPFDILTILINQNMKGEEKRLYLDRYNILRQLYYNLKVFNEAYKITDSIRNDKTIYRLIVSLKSNEKPAFYEKFTDTTRLFSNQDLISFFKGVGERLKESDFGTFFERQQVENSEITKSTVKELATIKQSTTTLFLLAVAMVGLFIGVGATLQHLLGGIYTSIVKTTSSGVATSSSISSVLSIFQLITTLPPVSYAYIILPIVAVVIIYKLKKDSQEMFS